MAVEPGDKSLWPATRSFGKALSPFAERSNLWGVCALACEAALCEARRKKTYFAT